MAQEIGDDSTKTRWSIWSYQEYRKLLDEEMTEVCRIYAEVELADLPVSKGKEAKGWLTDAHQEAERAREHIGERIKGIKVLRALLYPATERRARVLALREAKGAGTKPREQAEEAAARARLQAARAIGTPERSQLAEGVDTGSEETRSGQQRLYLPAYTQRSQGRPGGLNQRVRHFRSGGNAAAFQRSPRLRRLPTRAAVHAAAPTPPPPPGNGKARRKAAMQEAEELPAEDTREESQGRKLPPILKFS
jgi:hypothetical protein